MTRARLISETSNLALRLLPIPVMIPVTTQWVLHFDLDFQCVRYSIIGLKGLTCVFTFLTVACVDTLVPS